MMAYLKKLLDSEQHGIPEEYAPSDIDPVKDARIIALKNNTSCDDVAQGSAQGHLLQAYYKKPNYLVSGKYTSMNKGNSMFFSSLQINFFQTQKEQGVENSDLVYNTKPHYFYPQIRFSIVHEDRAAEIKYDQEFHDFAQNHVMLQDLFEEQKRHPVTILDCFGLTSKRAVIVSKDYDYNTVKSQKHPITLDKKSLGEESTNNKNKSKDNEES